jgi:uncharacterized protein YggU (UPF0235/DUF167 family)
MAAGRIKVYIQSAPDKAKANRELIEYLAGKLDVPKSSIKIIRGQTGKAKVLRIINIDPDYLKKNLI